MPFKDIKFTSLDKIILLANYQKPKLKNYNLSNKKLINDALSDADGKPSDPNFEPRWYWIGMKNFINLLFTFQWTLI